MSGIPAPVLQADAEHHRVLQEITFSRHLNPTNAPEARRAFLAGAHSPPFEYIPLPDPDGLMRRLEAMIPPQDHPAGQLVAECVEGTLELVAALRDRSAEAFDRLAQRAGWYPDPSLLHLEFYDDPSELQALDVPAARIMARLREALELRGLQGWTVVEDTVMSARVLVDGAKRTVRVNPHAMFRRRDLERLVVHEIDVHAMRSAAGERQVLRVFETGLPDSLITEEGLALLAEERAGVSSPGVLSRQLDVVRAIQMARTAGFREVYQELASRSGPSLAWGICLRIKRGLGHPELPGVYAKDSVYLVGRLRVERWLREGGDLAHLYVGKVGVCDPVGRWLKEGWLRPSPVPPVWRQQRA